MRLEIVREVTDELVDAFNRLLPQHSRGARTVSHADLAAVVAAPSNTVLVARDDAGTSVGTTTLVVYPTASNVLARIEDVVVDAAARGRGIGAALTLAAIELARQAGAVQVELNSGDHRQAAIRLYTRLGFVKFPTNTFRYTLDQDRA